MIERAITGNLLAALADTPVVLLTGGRQTGKSTLASGLAGHGYRAEYVTFDDTEALVTARGDPQGFINRFRGPVILDEVQRVPETFLPIKASVDRDRRPGRFLLTGSANLLLLPALSDALVGRVEPLTLWPFSQAELEGQPRARFVDRLFADDPQLPTTLTWDREELAERLLRGGFPEAVERRGEQRLRRWFTSYLTTVLEREVRDIANIELLERLPQLLSAAALRVRGPLNRSALSQDLGIPQTSIDRYLMLLERVFLTKRIPAWHGRLNKRLMKSPKLLLADSGLLCALLRLDRKRLSEDSTVLGVALENFVGMEIVKDASLSTAEPLVLHYRTVKGMEIDFLLETTDGRVAAVEVKAGRTLRAEDFKRFEPLRDHLGERFVRGVVLYTGDKTLPFGDRVEAWPISALWSS